MISTSHDINKLTHSRDFLQQNVASDPNSDGSIDTSTSIIITSNLIPTHPSLDMINETIHSLRHHLLGLPSDAPLFLSVDGIHKNDADDKSKQERLNQYIHNLHHATFPFTNVTIIPAPRHLHIAQTVRQALDMVQTKFVYVIQHDLPFSRDVYHSELVQAMFGHPTTLRIVLFKLENAIGRFPVCPVHNNKGEYPREEYEMLDFYATKRWSDNNHLTTKAYYDEMFDTVDHLMGAIEWGMMGSQIVVIGGRLYMGSEMKII